MGEGLGVGEGDGLGVAVGDGLGDGFGVGAGVGLGEAVGVGVGLGVAVGEGSGLIPVWRLLATRWLPPHPAAINAIQAGANHNSERKEKLIVGMSLLLESET